MTRELVFREEAEQEIDEIWARYDSLSSNLAHAFLEELIDVLINIQEFPQLYQTVRRSLAAP